MKKFYRFLKIFLISAGIIIVLLVLLAVILTILSQHDDLIQTNFRISELWLFIPVVLFAASVGIFLFVHFRNAVTEIAYCGDSVILRTSAKEFTLDADGFKTVRTDGARTYLFYQKDAEELRFYYYNRLLFFQADPPDPVQMKQHMICAKFE